MTEEPQPGVGVSAFLAAASRYARRRAAFAAVLDLALIALGSAWLATGIAAVSHRGDLVRPALIAAITALGATRLWFLLQQIQRVLQGSLATARAVARHVGPLRRPQPNDDPQRPSIRADRLLRHEIVAAAELSVALRPTDGEPDRIRAAALGSALLAARYVQDVEQRLAAPHIDARWALPHRRPRWRLGILAAGLLASGAALAGSTTLQDGVGVWVAGLDARPATPPEPVWASLTLQLDYPTYTDRPRRVVPNPSGALRVPAGTEVTVRMTARRPAAAGRLVVTYDAAELSEAPPPEIVALGPAEDHVDPGAAQVPTEGMHWQGRFVARGSGTWMLILLDDPDDDSAEASRRSAPLPLAQEPDRPPEVELLPLPRERRQVRENDTVDLEFVARDDFGLAHGQLVYQLPDGSAHRLAIDAPARPRRNWRRRHTWDISQIPIAERSEVLYWIEVRDNDPGLSLTPLVDPPGKLTRSATMRLIVRDDEAEHAANIASLREIRDFAVDLLALRMLTRAFEDAAKPAEGRTPLPVRAAMARDLLARSSELLARLADAIDALSMDSMAQPRDAATLTKVHQRLAALHRDELKLHEGMPPRSEHERPEDAEGGLRKLSRHNATERKQLEDEIIRLDDLVHGQIIERLEALVARLEATQRKMVELLEQLAAGDPSVRAQIDQLQQRRREDLRRLAEVRAMLSQEVEQEFMNLDAFKALQSMQRDQELSEMLQRGEVDQALQHAQQQLGEIQGLRDQVQQKLGETGPGPELSEEEKKRMRLLRELSRLQDDEGTLRGRTQALHETWRQAVSGQASEASDRKAAADKAKAMQDALDKINDARLGRDARRSLQDATDELERLSSMSSEEKTSALELAESAERIAEALQRAVAGSEPSEAEGKALRRAQAGAAALQKRLDRALPPPSEALGEAERQALGELKAQQQGLGQRAGTLMADPLSDLLPREGQQAMKRARHGMGSGAQQLDLMQPGQAVRGAQRAWDGIQEAIESLRQGSPPPPNAASGDASTETERDLTLRDALMDAMREQPPEGYAEPVQRYYEELLR